MKTALNILTIAVLLVVGCRTQQESSFRAGYDFSGVDKIAIVSVEGAVPSEAAKDEIADFFSIELLAKGYAPMGRAQVRATLGPLRPAWLLMYRQSLLFKSPTSAMKFQFRPK